MKLDPVHRSLVAVDIEGYSRRQNQGHLELRAALRQIMADAFDSVSVEIDPAELQDQGDAFLALVKPEVSKVKLVDGLVRELENALRRYNRYRTKEGKIRLRVALHSGEVHPDGTGFAGEAIVTVMRLIDAEQVKKALATATKDIAVIVSDGLYQDIVVHSYSAIVPEEYSRVEVAVKEFHQPAWVRVPGYPAADVILGTPAVTPSATSQGSRGHQPETSRPAERGGLFNSAYFAGPTSFGGYAAGRDINLNRQGGQHDYSES
jgi:class 3 adenylate cyclase